MNLLHANRGMAGEIYTIFGGMKYFIWVINILYNVDITFEVRYG